MKQTCTMRSGGNFALGCQQVLKPAAESPVPSPPIATATTRFADVRSGHFTRRHAESSALRNTDARAA